MKTELNMKWVNVNVELPPQGVPIKIRAKYNDDLFIEATCIFHIEDIDERTESWIWTLSAEEHKKYGDLRPTHWMPIPNPPELNDFSPIPGG